MGDYQLIGQMLLRKGAISHEQLDIALNFKGGPRRRLGEVLVALGFASELQVVECLAEQFGFDVVAPSEIEVDQNALKLLTGDVALAHRILPTKYCDDCIECVMADPVDFPTQDMISQIAGKRTTVHLAPAASLVEAIRKAYDLEAPVASPVKAAVTRRPGPPRQRDREAVLAQWDIVARATEEHPPANCATLIRVIED